MAEKSCCDSCTFQTHPDDEEEMKRHSALNRGHNVEVRPARFRPDPVRSSDYDPNDRRGQPWAPVNPYNKQS